MNPLTTIALSFDHVAEMQRQAAAQRLRMVVRRARRELRARNAGRVGPLVAADPAAATRLAVPVIGSEAVTP